MANSSSDVGWSEDGIPSSPAVDFINKRPSYLEISMTLPGHQSRFDVGVIRSLETQFQAIDNLPQEQISEEEEEEQVELIKTYLRIRPYTHKSEDEVPLLEIQDDKSVIANFGVPGALGKRMNKRVEFKFTRVLDDSCSQEEVYEESIEPLLDRFDGGENCLIFSYGATNSGKTYTMRGSSTKYGIIPRTLYHIFDRYQDRIYKGGEVQPFRHESTRELLPEQYKILLDKKKLLMLAASDTAEMKQRPMIRHSIANTRKSDASSHCASVRYFGGASLPPELEDNRSMESSIFGMWVSFVELYNEKCYDLLSYGRRNEVKIVSEKGGYAYFKDVTELPVFNEEEAFALYVAGCNKLEVSSTLINQTSSRSHSFFTIRVVELGKTSQSVYPIKVHRMTFSDLAGCERIKQTENTGGQLRESANINQSLLSLLRVIRMMRDKQSQNQGFLETIPFRDSKLTRIFQGYFTTSTHIAMIVNVNPIPKMMDSSMQTLINSAIASKVVAFRPKQSTQSLVVVENNNAQFNSSFLHSSLDLEDVMEETEEEMMIEENRPPPPIPVPQVSLSYNNKPIPNNPTTKTTVVDNNNKAPPPPFHQRMGILKEHNNIITQQSNYRKNNSSSFAKFNNFKKPKPLEKENKSFETEYQSALLENQRLQNIIADLHTDLMLRDKALENMEGKIKAVESETREQMLLEMSFKMQSLREQEQKNYMKKLERSDQRSSQYYSRLGGEIEKTTVATQTD